MNQKGDITTDFTGMIRILKYYKEFCVNKFDNLGENVEIPLKL